MGFKIQANLPMHIVCLSTLGVSSGYVVDQLLAAFPETKLIGLTPSSPVRSWRSRIRRLIRGHAIRRIEHRLYYRRRQARGAQNVQQQLFGDRSPGDRNEYLRLRTGDINTISTQTLIRSLRPDLMITIGAPLLKPHIYSIPKFGTINVHFGIAPQYRGEETVFWPMYYRDEQRIGVTIHQIDRGIDTGPTLAQGFVAVDRDDTEWTWEAKSARLGARLLIELVQNRQFQPIWQPPRVDPGRQFNYAARHVWNDALVYFRRAWRNEAPLPSAERVVNYCAAPDSLALADHGGIPCFPS